MVLYCSRRAESMPWPSLAWGCLKWPLWMTLPAAVSSRQDPFLESNYSDSVGIWTTGYLYFFIYLPVFKVNLIYQITVTEKERAVTVAEFFKPMYSVTSPQDSVISVLLKLFWPCVPVTCFWPCDFTITFPCLWAREGSYEKVPSEAGNKLPLLALTCSEMVCSTAITPWGAWGGGGKMSYRLNERNIAAVSDSSM